MKLAPMTKEEFFEGNSIKTIIKFLFDNTKFKIIHGVEDDKMLMSTDKCQFLLTVEEYEDVLRFKELLEKERND